MLLSFQLWLLKVLASGKYESRTFWLQTPVVSVRSDFRRVQFTKYLYCWLLKYITEIRLVRTALLRDGYMIWVLNEFRWDPPCPLKLIEITFYNGYWQNSHFYVTLVNISALLPWTIHMAIGHSVMNLWKPQHLIYTSQYGNTEVDFGRFIIIVGASSHLRNGKI